MEKTDPSTVCFGCGGHREGCRAGDTACSTAANLRNLLENIVRMLGEKIAAHYILSRANLRMFILSTTSIDTVLGASVPSGYDITQHPTCGGPVAILWASTSAC